MHRARKAKDMNKDFIKELFNLHKKNVLVTGATGQLGNEICAAFVGAGAYVIGTDKDLDKKGQVESKNCEYLKMDITDKASVIKTFKEIYARLGKIDILVNNAGVSVFEPFAERPEESFDWVMDVNLKGTFFCIQAYAKHLKDAKSKGNIVNIASIYGILSPDYRIYTDCKRKNSEIYGATKAGIIQMTKYFAVHLAEQKTRVNCVSPGGIINPELHQGDDFVKNYSNRCPMGRMADTKDIIGGILYLSSDASEYVTGQNLVIDGGMSCW
ncbi:MAG: SDR family oxidoreductase [Candidatus Omnitrophica bacterium]|nr:SDR family oxidoreductase [Candidatus Omnitrophota bacterium]